MTPPVLADGVLQAVPFLVLFSAGGVLFIRRSRARPDRALRATVAVILAAAVAHVAAMRPWIGLGGSLQNRGAPPGYVRFEQVVVAALVLAFAVLAVSILRAAKTALASRRWMLAAAFAFAAAPRLLIPADLLHSEQFGIRLLSDMAAFPDPAMFRYTWGQTSFVVLGAVMRVAGSHRAVFVANALFGALTTVLWAALVLRWTSSRWAAAATLVAVALHPGLLRIAASEDPHNLQLFFFSAALLAIDTYLDAPDDRRDAALLAAIALVLAAWSRQTFLLLLPMVPLFVVGRGGRRALLRREVVAGAGLVVAAVLTHALATAPSDQRSFQVMVRFAPRLAAAFVHEPNPIVDPLVSPAPLAVLALIGLVAPVARSARPALAVGIATTWAFTGIFGFGDAGVRLLFRAPLLLLVAAAMGLGVAALERAIAIRRARAFRAATIVILLAYCAAAVPGIAWWARRDPLAQELAFIEGAVDELPRGTTIAVPRYEDFPTGRQPEEPKPEWIFPEFLLRGHDLRLVARDAVAPPGHCAVFYRGLLCYTFGLGEASSEFRELWRARGAVDTADFMERLVDAILAFEAHPPVVPPDALRRARSACFDRNEVEPLPGLVTEVAIPRHPYVTNVVYAADSMQVGFFAAPGSPCAAHLATRSR